MIGCEDRLRNDLYCVGWGVKLCSTSTQWRQREFKVGGDEAPKGWGVGEGSGGGHPENFLFCDLEMAYFGEF